MDHAYSSISDRFGIRAREAPFGQGVPEFGMNWGSGEICIRWPKNSYIAATASWP